MDKITDKILAQVYGKNYDIRHVVENLLEPYSNKEKESYDKLCEELTDKQKKLLNTYLHLYAERIFKMQDKRFNAGFRAGMYFGSHSEKK